MDNNAEKYVEVDNNMIIETTFPETDIVFHDIRKFPFDVYGFYDYENQPIFRRLPEDVATATSPGVQKLCRECSGGRVRFCTDSKYVAIHVDMISFGRSSHIALEGSAGFDLYEDCKYDSHFIHPLLPPYDMTDGYTQIQRFADRKLRYFTINFPTHAVVKNFYVGVQDGAVLDHGIKYRNEKPVIIYGSSIVHGTAASRPGLTYPNIIANRQNINYINLGFSGKALAEETISNYMSTLTMSIFVCDYDHNAPNPEFLRATHQRLYDIIRSKNPDVPYIMITRPNAETNPIGAKERKDVIIDTFRYATSNGDKNVYYMDGDTFFTGPYENSCTMDGVHPNDLGFALMADAIENQIVRIIRNSSDFANKFSVNF